MDNINGLFCMVNIYMLPFRNMEQIFRKTGGKDRDLGIQGSRVTTMTFAVKVFLPWDPKIPAFCPFLAPIP